MRLLQYSAVAWKAATQFMLQRVVICILLLCRYCVWWGCTIALAAFTGVYEPWVVAFVEHSEES